MSHRGITRRRFLALGLAAGAAGVALGSARVRGALPSELGGRGGAAGSPLTGSAPTATAIPAFDGERAYRRLVEQCDFGPRVPGTSAHRACRDYLRERLAGSLGEARLQPFSLELPSRAIPMWNVLAEHAPGAARQVLLCAHWDTRPTADEEPDPRLRRQPILGANDGASGVAVLLEIAGLLRAHPPPVGVRFVLFDGEDYGPGSDRMYLGAKRYARTPPLPHPRWGALLDMVGDLDLDIWRERHSEDRAQAVNDRLFGVAEGGRHAGLFHDDVRWTITDDHLPLLDAGIPIVNLIDFDYPHWHRLSDTPDKCSPQSLQAVGDTVLRALYASG